MDISNKAIWQVACGDTDRNYADICLKWDVILNGPGAEGSWPECEQNLRSKWKLSEKKLTDLRRFHSEIKHGDIVILRLGTTDVLGVGIVEGAYSWHRGFGDIDGWDLQHIRRVNWVWDYKDDNKNKPRKFDSYSMKFGDTTQLLNDGTVKNWIVDLDVSHKILNKNIINLPDDIDYSIKIDEIFEQLFLKGVSSSNIRSLSNEIDDLRRIADWYRHTKCNPSEAETIAYLIVPILRLLGWTPQKMAIEWNYVDIALFDEIPRKDKSLCAVVEAKLKGASCLNAKSQAQDYAKKQERAKCKRLIVTDGIRYGVYLRNEDGFSDHPDAYLNLLDLKSRYDIIQCGGATDALLLMSADFRGNSF